MIDVTFLLRLLEGRCYGNQLSFGTNSKNRHWLTPPSSLDYFELAFQNELEYRKADGRVDIGDDSPLSCRNLEGFEPVTAKITSVGCNFLQ